MSAKQPIPDLQLEKLAAGELSETEEKQLLAALEQEPGGAARLEQIRASNEEILNAYPAHLMAVQIRAKHEAELNRSAAKRPVWVPVTATVATGLAAALALMLVLPGPGTSPGGLGVVESALGGADLCKDDEMCSELANCSFDDRLDAVLRALEKAEQETGEKTLYMVSVTDEVNRIQEKARRPCRGHGPAGRLSCRAVGPQSSG